MKTPRAQPAPRTLAALRTRLAEAEATIRAIRSGEVDAIMGTDKRGPQVFTLEGANHPYRVLIESMNEGALTLTADKTILYANHCFARMVLCPLEQVTGGSFHRFLSAADQTALRSLMQRAAKSGSKIQACLRAGDGSRLPVQISVPKIAKARSSRGTIALVVTDMTEARRTEEMLRAFSNRVLQVQEAERARVALELHDHITQLLCAILFRCEALVMELSTNGGPSLKEARHLREMLGTTAHEVERISRNLRPGILNQLGLEAVLRATAAEFAERTGVPVKLSCEELDPQLPADVELALYRILQEALKNVERHARAHGVTASLTQHADTVRLRVKDDGIGFDPDRATAKRKGKRGLGLLGMSERATYVGAVLTIKSARGAGTEIEVSVPLSPS
ncbi:MAG: PAS domain-containing protein [Opitutaceae bacterium]|nr:PAS domain-containing protein [Opitutaceae bacterium]